MSGKGFLDSFGVAGRVEVPAGASGGAILKLNPAMIDGDPGQPRREFDPEKLAELAESLKRHGQLQAISVRRGMVSGRYIVVAGERRLRATKLAGLSTIDAVLVSERVDIDTVREVQVVENLQRSNLSPTETAEAYRSLMARWSCSQAELARRLGVGTATVSRALALLEPVDEAPVRAQRPRRRQVAKPDKRRAVELDLAAGVVRVKRGHTLEELVEELRARLAAERTRSEAA